MAGSAPVAAPAARTSSADANTNYLAPLSVLTSLFFMWGFLTCLNDIIIPHLKGVFELNYAQAMMIQFAFFTAYFVVSLPAGSVVKKVGYKAGIIIGLLVAAGGCLLFYPAAGARSYPMFLAALFVLASGITLLQVAANPFVAVLGKPETASSRLTLTQAFNSLGTTIAPALGSILILGNAVKSKAEIAALSPSAAEAYRVAEAASVQKPYLGLTAALVALAVAIAAFKLPKIAGSEDATAAGSDQAHKSAWSYRHLVLGALAIFVYVGGEVSIGSFLVNYFKEPSIGGLTEAAGAKLVSFYWGGAMIGRFIGTVTLRMWKPGKVLALHAVGAVLLIAITMSTTGSTAMYTVLAVGLFNSIMFPTIFTLAIDGLGKHTGQGSGILCMAIVGGALLPVLQGAVADAIGIHHCFIVALLCYVYIAWYGAKGSTPVAQKA
ncbi:MAG TPA: L-fucose:H+ symporter permease [Polyangia bacterium]|jgi:FHS family L-fucose permease-like MFS transporter|nr:L-fucose:H+ symporter permease [Polyangia bacterium]